MPVLGTMGAMSARGFGALASLGGGYWIGTLAGVNTDLGRAIALDQFGNVFIGGTAEFSGAGTDFEIAKYNTFGAIEWQRRLGGTNNQNLYGLATDSSGNVYACGNEINSFNTIYNIQIAKYNSTGVIQWQRKLGGGGNINYAIGIAVDSSANVYICGRSNNSGVYDFQIAKYNTSGVIQWQRRLSDGVYSDANGVAVDASGNVYVCGGSTNASNYGFQLVKYNTSGVIQWQRALDTIGAGGIALDSSANIYVCSIDSNSYVSKYDTNGVIQWQRRINSNFSTSIAVDLSGNVYVCGYIFPSLPDLTLVKYNTSGVIQWQRSLDSSFSDIGYAVKTDASGNVYVCGNTASGGGGNPNNFLFAKLPADGSKTGTYTVGGVSFTYAASSLTETSTSFANAASTLTDSASTLTDSASTLTDAATTLTSSVTQI